MISYSAALNPQKCRQVLKVLFMKFDAEMQKTTVTPLKINMEHVLMEVWKIIFLYKWVICRFHVNLPGCIPPGKDRCLSFATHNLYLEFIMAPVSKSPPNLGMGGGVRCANLLSKNSVDSNYS